MTSKKCFSTIYQKEILSTENEYERIENFRKIDKVKKKNLILNHVCHRHMHRFAEFFDLQIRSLRIHGFRRKLRLI